MIKAQRIFACFMILTGVLIVYNSFSLGKSIVKYDIGPAVYPRILAGLIVFFSVVIMFRPIPDEGSKEIQKFNYKFFIFAGIMIVFLLLLKPLGFVVSAFLVMIPMMIFMGEKRPLRYIGFPLLFALIVYFIFTKVLHASLPAGILSFL
jgi:hypothetical protein